MTSIGKLIKFGIKKESVRGTAETISDLISATSVSFVPMATKVNDEGSIGTIDDINKVDLAQTKVEANVDGILKPNSTTALFEAALGESSTADNGDGSYTHTITLKNDNSHPSYTLFGDDTIDSKKALRGMLSELSLAFNVEEHITFSSSWIASETETASETPSYTNESNFISRQANVYLADTVAELDTADSICLNSLNITIAKNLLEDYCLGKTEINEIYNQQFGMAGDFELIYNNSDIKDWNFANTKKAMKIEIVGNEIDTGINNTIEITLGSVAFQDWGHSTGLNDVITQNVGFIKEKGEPTNVEIDITNTLATL